MSSQIALFAVTALWISLTTGCGEDTTTPEETAPPSMDELIQDARAGSERDPEGSDFKGIWRVLSPVEGNGVTAWADLIWIVGETHAWHAVLVYADEAQTVPLARWDIVRGYRLGGPAAISDTAVELDWQDVSSYVTTYVDVPQILEILGVDDCNATMNVPMSTATDNCGEPFFPFRDCTLMDFVDINPAGLTFGEPRATDRCVERVDVYEAWTFQRVPFDDALGQILDDRPAEL
ncbi:MAG: hypothetical protein ACE366_16145 [Bradymonadia bacterium]